MGDGHDDGSITLDVAVEQVVWPPARARLRGELAALRAERAALLARCAAAEDEGARLRATLTVVAQQAHGAHGGRGSFRWCGVECCRNANYALSATTAAQRVPGDAGDPQEVGE